MKVWTLGLAAVLASGTMASSGTVEAKPAGKTKPAGTVKQKAQTLTHVRVCPISGTPVNGKGAGTQVVGKYMVHFC